MPPGAVVRWAVGDQWVKSDLASGEAVKWGKAPELWTREGLTGVSGEIELADGRTLRVCAFPISQGKWQVRVGAWVLPVRLVIKEPEKSKSVCPSSAPW